MSTWETQAVQHQWMRKIVTHSLRVIGLNHLLVNSVRKFFVDSDMREAVKMQIDT